MTQFRMSAAMRMKIGDLSVGNARGWGGLGRAFTGELASSTVTNARQSILYISPHHILSFHLFFYFSNLTFYSVFFL